MSEGSKRLVASAEHNEVGPNYFGFYVHEVVELLSREKNLLSCFSQASELSARTGGEVEDKNRIKHGCDDKDAKSSTSSGSLFSNSIGAGTSDFVIERLKALLRQSVISLTQEVNEMVDPVLSIQDIKTHLRCKKHQSQKPDVESNGCAEQFPFKKLKVSSPNATHFSAGASREVNDDLKILLEHDYSLVEERMKKYSDELSETLRLMGQQLEELLNSVMCQCRPMTRREKQQLQKMIQKLPPKNLERAVEIIQRGKPPEIHTDEVHVNLEKEDNVTLWRLYYYAEAVEKAKKLSRSAPQN